VRLGEDRARTEEMITMRRSGATYAAIGARHGVTRERVRQILRRAAADGKVCLDCGKPSAPWRYCQEHALEHAMAARDRQRAANRDVMRRIHAARKRAGRCWSCGGKLRVGRVLCADCAEDMNTHLRRRYAARKAEGLCVRCGQPVGDGGSYCGRCRAAVNEWWRKSKARSEARA
jgi:predicted amidophosphoribosyltransferase